MTPPQASRRSYPSKGGGESPDEVLACVGMSGRIFPLDRERVHREGIHHLVVRVLAFDPGGRYLVQRRSESKESCPGYYTDSASGHVSFSFGLLFDREGALKEESTRELEEEVGLSPVEGENGPLIRAFSEPARPPGSSETSHCYVAVVEGEPRPSDEVDPAGTGFVGRGRLVEMMEEEKFVPVARDFWLELLSEVGEENPCRAMFGR